MSYDDNVDWIVTCCLPVGVARPYWRQNKPPGDKVVNEEADAEFECHADGMPQPRISWFINGIPIECTFYHSNNNKYPK